MSAQQPKALRLAQELEGVYPVNIQDQEAAAAELRRLHSENEYLNLYASGADILVGAWKARAQDFMTQRDELLMALKELLGPYVAKP